MTSISIVIPVLNEPESTVNQHLSLLQHPQVIDMIFVDGNISASSISQINHPQVLKAYTLLPGRASQLNFGASLSTGHYLLFLHCDTRLSSQHIDDLIGLIKKKALKAGAFDLKFSPSTPLTACFSMITNIRSRLTRIPYGDQAQFFERQFFMDLGGYPALPLLEDLAIMSQIKSQKNPISILSRPVLTSDRRYRQNGWIKNTLNNWKIIRDYRLGIDIHDLANRYK